MITLQNTTKSVKVLKANGMPTQRIIPGFNYIDMSIEKFKRYKETEINRAVIKESIKLIDFELSEEDSVEAKKALETNKKLNKAQKVIDKQNKQILEKDENNSAQAKMLKEQKTELDKMADLVAQLQKDLAGLKKKDK